jgi:hypothetical protein
MTPALPIEKLVAGTRGKLETNLEARANFAAARAMPTDVVGDWLCILAGNPT